MAGRGKSALRILICSHRPEAEQNLDCVDDLHPNGRIFELVLLIWGCLHMVAEVPVYQPVQGHFFAHSLLLESLDEDAFTRSLSAARVDMNPHQVEASLFALKSPLAKACCSLTRSGW